MNCINCGYKCQLTKAIGPCFWYHCDVCGATNETIQTISGGTDARAYNQSNGWFRGWRPLAAEAIQ